VALFVSGGANQTLTRRMFVTLRDEIDPTIAAISTMLTALTLAMVLMVVITRRGNDAADRHAGRGSARDEHAGAATA
ncbi:ABC transporter permease, partial [Burkholderia gladioli]|nr:ABC transporter permease [Burkholderia gladioli]